MSRKLAVGTILVSLACSNAAFSHEAEKVAASKPDGDRTDLALTGYASPDIRIQTKDEARMQDLELVAKAKGWTIAEAAADRRAADAVGEAAVKLAERYPERFVGSELAREPGGTPRLYVKGYAGRAVRDIAAASDVYIEVVDNQPYSFEELQKRKLDVHYALASAGYEDILTSFDFRESGRIDATVTRKAGLPESSRAIRQVLPVALRDSVQLSIQDAPVGVDFFAYGGMAVNDDGVFECTAGWSVRHSSGTTGVTTAGHCNGINQINHPGVGNHSMSHRGEHRGIWGDIEWKTTTATESADFYANASSIREVNSVEPLSGISIGESVCFYGRSSNRRDCSFDVLLPSVSCTVSGVFNASLVMMNGNSAIGGDSGGGWSWGNKAYGSVKGHCGGLAVWSVADLYDEALGVTVRTQ